MALLTSSALWGPFKCKLPMHLVDKRKSSRSVGTTKPITDWLRVVDHPSKVNVMNSLERANYLIFMMTSLNLRRSCELSVFSFAIGKLEFAALISSLNRTFLITDFGISILAKNFTIAPLKECYFDRLTIS